jgi:hypothetical protein
LPIRTKDAVINHVYPSCAVKISGHNTAYKPVVNKIAKVFRCNFTGYNVVLIESKVYPADIFSPRPAVKVAVIINGNTVIIGIVWNIRVEVYPADILSPSVTGQITTAIKYDLALTIAP